MRTFSRVTFLSVLAFAGLLVSSSTTWAHGNKVVVRSKYVSRGGVYPGVGVVPVGTARGEFFSLGFTGAEFAPLVFTSGSSSTELSLKERVELEVHRTNAEAAKKSGSNPGTTTPSTTPATDTTCKDLATRVGKIEDKVNSLDASVKMLQAKVDQLYDAEMQKRQAAADEAFLAKIDAKIAAVAQMLTAQSKNQAKIMADLAVQLQIQPATAESKAKIADLLKQLNP